MRSGWFRDRLSLAAWVLCFVAVDPRPVPEPAAALQPAAGAAMLAVRSERR
jgi:hypothetical protein